jgi:hypothetical protein
MIQDASLAELISQSGEDAENSQDRVGCDHAAGFAAVKLAEVLAGITYFFAKHLVRLAPKEPHRKVSSRRRGVRTLISVAISRFA